MLHFYICRFDKTSKGVTKFSRDVEAHDLIQMPYDETSGNSLGYSKHEESVFVKKRLHKSRGKMSIKLDFGDLEDDDDSNNDIDKDFDFGKEFQSNGSYLIQKAYCKRRTRRNVIFSDLEASSVNKATLLATIDLC